MVKLLLENGGKRVQEILANFTPRYKSKEEYLNFLDTLWCDGDRIEYLENGTAKVKID